MVNWTKRPPWGVLIPFSSGEVFGHDPENPLEIAISVLIPFSSGEVFGRL